ncbi:class I SAM-dependent methyltransferase [Sneathiella limimaris]|uniref:class I SAM-dependent methyltransferase n=1 Tax=Sneathiella limimaris TaxID=1964213 RepID=UPI0019D2687A|nr:class I SAM-dependent methyltransferase [Sneathiella limimaris]
MGLKTLFNIQKQGFFIPYRYADTLLAASSRQTYPALLRLFQNHEQTFIRSLESMSQYLDRFQDFGSEPPPFPRWEQDWFPRLDGAAAYTQVRNHKPKRIIEVGSGHSTRFMLQAAKDGDLQVDFTAIDPAPRADITKLPITIHNDIVQNMDLSLFEKLEAGDILFIDSSHIAMPGTDVDFLFLNVLPLLPKGVIVHIHDICLPYDYPKSWEWRGYNEQQMVAPLLMGSFKLLFSSAYAERNLEKILKETGLSNLPISSGAKETSLWLEKQ